MQAKHYTSGPRTKGPVRVVVVHSMEAPEKGTTAESVAAYFARGERVASAHYCIDADSIAQCVREADVAYHAPGANHDGIGLEHAGYARQTREEWLDPYGKAMLALSAKLAAEVAGRYGIPALLLSVADLKAGKRGFCSHHTVSLAYRRSSHTDPGTGFPWDWYLRAVHEEMRRKEWDAMATMEEVKAALREVIAKEANPRGAYALGEVAQGSVRYWWLQPSPKEASFVVGLGCVGPGRVGYLFTDKDGKPVTAEGELVFASPDIKGIKPPKRAEALRLSHREGEAVTAVVVYRDKSNKD